MKIIVLKSNPNLYSGNSYFVLGSWNKLSDLNTLVDTGTDGYIINEIENTYTGVGKVKVNNIILTHNHFDHAGGTSFVIEKYSSKLYAATKVDKLERLLVDGETILIGDEYFEVLFTPGHSSDSICLYNKKEKVLFSGDTCLRINSTDGSHTEEYINTMERLAKLEIKVIYPGHGKPITEEPMKLIKNSLINMTTIKL